MAKYYDIRDDLKKYPDAWAYFVTSKRGPGKTYSSLRATHEDKIPFIFMKRTQEDVEFLTRGMRGSKNDVDLSPFKPLNRDFGWNVRAFPIDKGLAAFYDTGTDEDSGEVFPIGSPLGYVLGATTASKYKGFDLSECDWMIFDEFIPRGWERVNRKEGDQVLDLYLTVQRDRLKRGKKELKLICLANATMINNPMYTTLGLIDIAAEMNVTGQEYYYDEYKGIMIHQLPATDAEDDTPKSGIERATQGTQFGDMAFGGKFAYNDFSAVKKANMKNYIPRCAYTYKNKTVYVYSNAGKYYFTFARNEKVEVYNLDQENQQKKFYYDWVIDLMNENIDGNVFFEKYSMYDLIVNYKKIFNI